MERKSFVFYKKWNDAIVGLPENVKLEIYNAIMRYAFDGDISDLKPMANIAFSFIKGDIDRDRDVDRDIEK